MIMSQRNWDYNKHCQVGFGAYIQANENNEPTNTLKGRTIDAIYLRPTDNIQGGHELMNLATGQVITHDWVSERPVTDLVIKAVETMAIEQGIKTLKITGRNKIALFPADWIAGVDYEEAPQLEDETDDDEDYTDDGDEEDYEDELDDEQAYDRVDQSEIDEILAEPGPTYEETEANPTVNEDDEEEELPVQEPAQEPLRRSTRTTRNQRDILNVETTQGKSYSQVQPKKAVHFELTNDSPTFMGATIDKDIPSEDYSPQMAMLMARLIVEMQANVSSSNPCFGQQYVYQKGIKKFGQKGKAAALKEV